MWCGSPSAVRQHEALRSSWASPQVPRLQARLPLLPHRPRPHPRPTTVAVAVAAPATTAAAAALRTIRRAERPATAATPTASLLTAATDSPKAVMTARPAPIAQAIVPPTTAADHSHQPTPIRSDARRGRPLRAQSENASITHRRSALGASLRIGTGCAAVTATWATHKPDCKRNQRDQNRYDHEIPCVH